MNKCAQRYANSGVFQLDYGIKFCFLKNYVYSNNHAFVKDNYKMDNR